MPQPLFSFMPTLRSRIRATSTGSGAPPEPTLPATTSRACRDPAVTGDRDPHRRDAGKSGGALDLDVAHHGFDVETLVQRDQVAAPDASAEPRSARRCGTAAARRSRARSHYCARRARLAPDIVDRHRRRQIAVAQHRALRQAGGAAGILQQRDIVGDMRPCRARRAVDESAEGDDRRSSGSGAEDCRPRPNRRPGRRSAGRPGPCREISAPSATASPDCGDQHARAAVGQLVRQRAVAIERGQMHDAGAGLQRAEEIDRMIRRIAEEQRDRVAGRSRRAGTWRRQRRPCASSSS